MQLKTEVNDFIKNREDDFKLIKCRFSKIIHLALPGTIRLSEFEVPIMDMPIVQRLKNITQLGAAHQVYPTAHHTRFDHSLGVLYHASKMWDNLARNNQFNFLPNESRMKLLNNIRAAALLHDIGHGPFSHVSEYIMKDFFNVRDSLLSNDIENPHELLAYHMLQTDCFKNFFDTLNDNYKDVDYHLENISKIIVAKTIKNEDQYVTDFINSQIDADKMDYILRDSYFSGVSLSLEIERLFHGLQIEEEDTYFGKRRKIVVNRYGVNAVEQLMFSKIMLNFAIYHHQKVRAFDQTLIAIFRMMMEDDEIEDEYRIKKVTDLLRMTDQSIFGFAHKKYRVCDMIKRYMTRNIYKRVLVINPMTIKNHGEDAIKELNDLCKRVERQEEIRELNRLLASRLGKENNEYIVAFDIPNISLKGEIKQKIIINHKGEFQPLSDIFPQKEWLEIFEAHKWTGYLFALDEYREKAVFEGKKLLNEKYGIKLSDDAHELAKIDSTYFNSQKTLSLYQ